MGTILEGSKSHLESQFPQSFRRNSESSFVVTLELLEHFLNTTLGYRWLPAAIDAGLLRMMAGVAVQFPSVFDKDRSRCRRCSGCRTRYYCSSNCQIADWQHGGHRGHCGSPALLSLGEISSCPLGFRERNFLRAVIQRDYEDGMHSICEGQVIFMATHPAARFFTLFDYTHNPVQISVQSVANSLTSDDLRKAGSEWTEILSRMERSRGSIQLHVIRIPQGSATRLWVIPMRTNRPQVHDALRQLARSIPTGFQEEDISDEVESILENVVDLLEIH
ncbi:hypothetical protein K438DRAFT_1015539 [Mycena galopus ATCC 62051]|nr:hypothetical protein K438DRAFT_1015539 [Mycena galopus ATCC 62051]